MNVIILFAIVFLATLIALSIALLVYYFLKKPQQDITIRLNRQ